MIKYDLQYFGGRGASSSAKGGAGGGVGAGQQDNEPKKTLYSKSQADELTKDYTPEMFLGDINNRYGGTLDSLRASAENNMPETLNIGGYEFQRAGSPFTTFEQKGRGKGKDVVMLEYQSKEKVGNEYPVLQVGIRVWRTPKGKVKSEIIRDGYTNKTRFW